jgi:hypothetical protein
MIHTAKPTVFGDSGAGHLQRDVSWYGTLALLAVSLALLASLFFSGCSHERIYEARSVHTWSQMR